MTRVHRTRAVGAALAIALVVGACSNSDDDAGDDDASDSSEQIGTLPDEAAEIMAKDPYASARWLYYVADAESGEVLLANRPDELVFTASTAKGFFVGSVYDTLGPDTTIDDARVRHDADQRRRRRRGPRARGVRRSGARWAQRRWRVASTTPSTSTASITSTPTSRRTRTLVGDPLAGLDDLARQIARPRRHPRRRRRRHRHQHLDRTSTDRRARSRRSSSTTTSSTSRSPAPRKANRRRSRSCPQTDYFTVESDVETVAEDGETVLSVDRVGGRSEHAGRQRHDRRRALAADDAPRRADAPTGPGRCSSRRSNGPASRSPRDLGESNDQSALAALRQLPGRPAGGRARRRPRSRSDGHDDHGDELQRRAPTPSCACSPSSAARTDCIDGLETVYELAAEAGIDTDVLFLVDGQGADPASTTPRQISRWMQWSRRAAVG